MRDKRILVIRLGAMGDILHALPAVATLHSSFPGARITWAVERKWTALLEGNPTIHHISTVDRTSWAALKSSLKDLRQNRYDLAIDFQGLYKSAILGRLARPAEFYGFHHSELREPLAAWLYTNRTQSRSAHVVEQNLDLVAAAGATQFNMSFPLPPGAPEGDLPSEPFVLASPFAGWTSKQWPIQHFSTLGRLLWERHGLRLVLNAPVGAPLPGLPPYIIHHSSTLSGLIDATRRAVAVVGVDSGPLHLAAALGKPGVAIFGPTDPARNGPYGGSLNVLRQPGVETTYKRGASIDPAMAAISPEAVLTALNVSRMARA